MKCPKDGGLFRTDHDLEMPALVCMTCAHRIYCPPPMKPIRETGRLSALFCVCCRVRAPMHYRRVCRLCLRKMENERRVARTV